MLALNDAAHNAEQYSAYVEQHFDERRQRVQQLDAFVRHRLRLYRQAQEHLQRQTSNKTIETVTLPPPPAPLGPGDTVVVLSQRSTVSIHDSTSFPYPIETTNRVRESKQRLASKQLVRPASTTASGDEMQSVGTWLDPIPRASTTNGTTNESTEKLSQAAPSTGNTLRRSMSETRLSSFALKTLTDTVTNGINHTENRKRLQATRALFMTIERRQVKEALTLNKQNKEMQRVVELKEAERLHQEEALAQQQVQPVIDYGTVDVNSTDPKQLARIRQQRLREQKRRELERYIRALKSSLRERCSKRGIHIPPLCSCHLTIWDSDPMTCSQNCSFYRNPTAFATSLHSLVASCQTNH